MRKLSLSLVLVALLTFSCSKTDWEIITDKYKSPKSIKRINVSNLEGLYAAVNNPANVGSTIVLAPGTYSLNPNYPNSGRLELAHDMSLVGQPGNPNAVVIDVTALPASAYVVPPTATYPVQLRTGPIRIGSGYNAIEWVTFKNDPQNNIRSMIQTDIVAKQNAADPAPPVQVRIAHTIVKGSSIGINIINRDAVSNGRIVEAEIENNEILDNNIPQFGSGIQIQNSQALTGAVIKVVLKGNYIHGNKNGLNLLNSSSENNRIIAKSIGDRLEENGVGVSLSAGLNTVGGDAKGNSIHFEAEGTVIQNNLGVPVPIPNFIPGGVFIAAANVGSMSGSSGLSGTVNNNKLEAIFKGCRIENNAGNSQINAFGAYSNLPSTLPAGSNNSTVLVLQGSSKNVTVNAIPSFPAEPQGTNTVTIHR
jgi:hypothetical protein